MTKKTICYILFFICASTSTFIFHLDDDCMMVTGIFPGILFILTAIICASFDIKLKFLPTLKFAVITYIIYIVVFYFTMFTSFFGAFVGIITGGLGALTFFDVFKFYIKPIVYKNWDIFGLGCLAFAINDIIILTPMRDISIEFFRRDITGSFSATLFIWQYIIGVRLTNQIFADKST